jgi:cobalt/nickel transport system permease protein
MTATFREASIPGSPVSRWDARWKLAGFVIFSVGVTLLHTPVAAGVAVGFGLGLAVPAGLLPRKTFARLGLFALAVSPVLVVFPLVAGRAGFWDGVTIVLRCLAVGAAGLVLVGTAPVHRTLAAARALGVPGLPVHLSQLTYRYTHLLAAEYRRVRVAMRARGFRPRVNALTYHALGHAAGAVLVRGADRADRVAHAMRARGFDGSYRTLTPFHTHVTDVLSFLAVTAATIALLLLDRS